MNATSESTVNDGLRLSKGDALELLGAALNTMRETGLQYRIGNRDDGRALLIVIEGAILAESGELVPMQ